MGSMLARAFLMPSVALAFQPWFPLAYADRECSGVSDKSRTCLGRFAVTCLAAWLRWHNNIIVKTTVACLRDSGLCWLTQSLHGSLLVASFTQHQPAVVSWITGWLERDGYLPQQLGLPILSHTILTIIPYSWTLKGITEQLHWPSTGVRTFLIARVIKPFATLFALTGSAGVFMCMVIACLSALEVPVHLYRGHRVSLTGRWTKLLAT